MTLLAFAAIALLAIVLPLVAAEVSPAFVSMSYGQSFVPFELLGLSGGVAILAVGGWALRRRRAHGPREWLAVVAPCLMGLHFLTLTSEYAQRRFDYDCYEYAGRAILAEQSPYRTGLIYLYPPPTAQSFAVAHRAVEALSEAVGWSAARDAVWDRVFYLYQCAQLLLLFGAYFGLRRFGADAGLRGWWLPALVAGLLVFDNAVFRTLRHGQINLFVLDLALAGVVLARRRPALAGLAVALAGHIKLYPLILWLPMTIAGRWRAAAWSVASVGAVMLVSSDFGRDFSLWRDFLELLRADFPGEIAFRNNSLHSLLFNTARLGFDVRGASAFVSWGTRLGALGFAVWYGLRFHARVRLHRAAPAAGEGDRLGFAAHAADALAFALLVSPSVWEHHYVMALPLALVAIRTSGAGRPGLVALGIFLMLVMPTFDVFLLGHHRLAGMLLLLAITPPTAVHAAGERDAS